jgi:hypothetical protein
VLRAPDPTWRARGFGLEPFAGLDPSAPRLLRRAAPATRTAGNLGRINERARAMIAGGGSLPTSWNAWTAPDGTGHQAGDLAAPPVRPPVQCRTTAGVAERGAPDRV